MAGGTGAPRQVVRADRRQPRCAAPATHAQEGAQVCRGAIGDTLQRQLINVGEIFGKIQREDFEHTTAGAGSLPLVRHVTARGPSPCAPTAPPRHAAAATIAHLTALGERREAKRERADHRQEPGGGSPRGAAPPHRAMTPDCPMSPGEQDSPDLICK